MKVGYWHGYKDGYAEGRIQALQEFERVLALRDEEMSDLRRDRDNQMQRADAAADLLLQHIGARAISLAGKHEEVAREERKVRAVQTLAALPDPTDDLPYGDPRGTFASAADASLFSGGEDVTTNAG